MLFFCFVVIIFLFISLCHSQSNTETIISYRGKCHFPTRHTFIDPTTKKEFQIGGISSLTFSKIDNTMIALSDRQAIFTLNVTLNNGTLDNESVQFTKGISLHSSTGEYLDSEGLAIIKVNSTNHMFISTETHERSNIYLDIWSISSNGTGTKNPKFLIPSIVKNYSRDNYGLEPLSSSPDGNFIITATEHDISADNNNFIRLLQFNTSDFKSQDSIFPLSRSLKYHIEKDFGLVEIIALDNKGLNGGRLLTLERFYDKIIGNISLLFDVDTRNADDISLCDGFATSKDCVNHQSVIKTLITNFTGFNFLIDNYESMSIFPFDNNNSDTLFWNGVDEMRDSFQSPSPIQLIMVNDNNFSPTQIGTQFLLFELYLKSDNNIIPASQKNDNDDWVLEFSDLNFLILTDVHSWIAGHKHPDSYPLANADFGDLYSFITHVKSIADKENKEIFVIENGDIFHGTGISDASNIRGELLTPLLMKMPYDFMNMGNHEVYDLAALNNLLSPNGLINHFQGKYLTSNSYLKSTQNTIGSKYFIQTTTKTNKKFIVFGFLYNMNDSINEVEIRMVSNVIEENWFTDSLVQNNVEAAIFLAHMDLTDPLVYTILKKVRSIVGETFPVLFVTGHTHYRGVQQIDKYSFSIESGRYFDTIGFVSMTLNQAANNTFHHHFINSNVQEMQKVVNISSNLFETANGTEIKNDIKNIREVLKLDRVLGCSNIHFEVSSGSLWRYYTSQVMPKMLSLTDENVILMTLGGLRYDLWNGSITFDDTIKIAPFSDRFWVVSKLNGSIINQLYKYLNHGKQIPLFLMTPTNLTESKLYKIIATDYDAILLETAIDNMFRKNITVEINLFPTNLTTTTIWEKFVKQELVCLSNDGENNDYQKNNAILASLIVVFSILFFILAFVFRVRIFNMYNRLSIVFTGKPAYVSGSVV